jgi:hypothetical protein
MNSPLLKQQSESFTRRRWLASGGAALWGTAAAAGEVPMPKTPQEAVDFLYSGNRRFVEGRSLSIHQDMRRV